MPSFKNDSVQIGREAELHASQYLQKHGLTFIEANYSCYYGEIDLIMQEGEILVFVEVRRRNRTDYGSALESVHWHKQRRLIKTATHFLQKKSLLYKVTSRFDIVAIQSHQGKTQLSWIKNAFTVDRY